MAAKNELIAIYRLEFYKKKKNWKFCQDVCKKEPESDPEPEVKIKDELKKPSIPVVTELNKTYNIETRFVGDQASVLNDAFIDAAIENTPPDEPIYLDQEETDFEVEKVWVDCLDNNCNEYEQEIIWDKPESPWEWPQSATDYYQQTFISQEENLVHYDHNSNYADCVGWHDAGQQDHITNDTWPQCHLYESPDYLSEALTNHWTLPHHTTTTWDTDSHARTSSLESLGSFMRGAARVPHSSEMDFTAILDEDVSRLACCMSLEPGGRLAGPAARAGTTNSQSGNAWQPRGPDTVSSESSFVAGSFISAPEVVGKGRGRLRAMPGVVVIRMGRPYRI